MKNRIKELLNAISKATEVSQAERDQAAAKAEKMMIELRAWMLSNRTLKSSTLPSWALPAP